MPGWNECGIYDERCRNKTCDHPTNPKNQGVQCRTMLAQRPCRNPECTRAECSRAYESAQAFMAVTKPATKNDSTGSVSVPQSQRASESMPSLERLTQAHVHALMAALDRDAVTNKQPTTELREAFRILCDADLDARGW